MVTGDDGAPGGGGWTRKGQATRARIVAAAAGLMFERGVAGTTTEDVRAAAGVSSSQLYHYFADKKALVRAVIAYTTEAVLDAQRPLLGQLDSLTALRAWRDLVVGLQRQRPARAAARSGRAPPRGRPRPAGPGPPVRRPGRSAPHPDPARHPPPRGRPRCHARPHRVADGEAPFLGGWPVPAGSVRDLSLRRRS